MDVKKIYNNKGKCISGLLQINPNLFHDSRGFFLESWNKKIWEESLKSQNQLPNLFSQDNHPRSRKGNSRKIHYQIEPYSHGELVWCINSVIYDLAVVLRKDSETFGKCAGIELSDKDKNAPSLAELCENDLF